MATRDYLADLNRWHLELAITNDLVQHILAEIEGDDWMTSGAHICGQRLAHLVETCPFPVTVTPNIDIDI